MIKKVLFLIPLFFINICFANVNLPDGTSNLNCGTNDYITENGALTISVWLKKRSLGGGINGRILQRGGVVFYGDQTAGHDDLDFEVGGGTTLSRITSSNPLAVDGTKYVNIILTWDGSTTAANSHIYANGTEATYGTTTNGATPTDNSGQILYIGNRADGQRGFGGYIDELAVWNTVLDSNSIAILSKSRTRRLPLTIFPANLKAYWALDECPDKSTCGLTYKDLSGNGNNCTSNNMPVNTTDTVLSYP